MRIGMSLPGPFWVSVNPGHAARSTGNAFARVCMLLAVLVWYAGVVLVWVFIMIVRILAVTIEVLYKAYQLWKAERAVTPSAPPAPRPAPHVVPHEPAAAERTADGRTIAQRLVDTDAVAPSRDSDRA